MWAAIRPWLFPVWCIGCGEPEIALCVPCAAGKPQRFTAGRIDVRAAALYEGHVRAAIIALKRGERAYLEPLTALLAPLVPRGAVLVPLPTTRRRAAERGFDQARELACRLALRGVASAADVLAKRGAAQRGLGRSDRLTARGRFAVRPHARVPAAAVLLDDVLTTGATLLDAARVLEAAGCRIAGAVVVARTLPGRETPRRDGRLVEA